MKNHSFSILVRQTTREPKSLLYYKKNVKNYLRQLFNILKRDRKKLLAYQVINNTVYFFFRENDLNEISKIVQHLHGIVSSDYSKITRKEPPFWKARPRYTLVQSGDPTKEVLSNLFQLPIYHHRALHPAGWWCSSYSESVYPKKRYRLIDRQAILEKTDLNDKEFSNWLSEIARDTKDGLREFKQMEDALAIGEESWIYSQYHLGRDKNDKFISWGSSMALAWTRNTIGNQKSLLRHKII